MHRTAGYGHILVSDVVVCVQHVICCVPGLKPRHACVCKCCVYCGTVYATDAG